MSQNAQVEPENGKQVIRLVLGRSEDVVDLRQ